MCVIMLTDSSLLLLLLLFWQTDIFILWWSGCLKKKLQLKSKIYKARWAKHNLSFKLVHWQFLNSDCLLSVIDINVLKRSLESFGWFYVFIFYEGFFFICFVSEMHPCLTPYFSRAVPYQLFPVCQTYQSVSETSTMMDNLNVKSREQIYTLHLCLLFITLSMKSNNMAVALLLLVI